MGLVATWLNGCGLSHAVPNFEAAGIVTPAALAELDLTHYEALGVSSPEDRRKLFYLVQRIKLAVEKERKETCKNDAPTASLEEQVDAVILSTSLSQQAESPTKTSTTTVSSSPRDLNNNFLAEGFSAGDDDDSANSLLDVLEQPHGESPREGTRESISPIKDNKKSATSNSKGSKTVSPSKTGKVSPSSRIPSPSAKSPSKQNASSVATSPGETTTPAKSLSPRKPLSVKATSNANSSSSKEDSGGADSSVWDEGEDDDCADDEMSTSLTATMTPGTRRSKRLAQKGAPQTASTRTATAAVPSKPTKSAIKQPAKVQASVKKTLASSRNTTTTVTSSSATTFPRKPSTSGLKTPQPKSKLGLQRQLQEQKNATISKPGSSSSSLPRHKSSSASRIQSKMQNPAKSMRTGKQLSTIPSNSILPMSPMPPARLDATEEDANKKTTTNSSSAASKKSTSGITGRSRSRRSIGGSVSDSSDSENNGSSRRHRRTSLDGSRRSLVQRSTSGGISDSDSSVNSSSSRRRSIGVLTAPQTKLSSGDKEGSKSLRGRRTTFDPTPKNSLETSTSSKKPTGNKGGVKIQGGSDTDVSWSAKIAAIRQAVSEEYELFSDDIFHDDEDDETIQVIVRKRPFHKDKPSDIDVIHPLEYGYYGKMLVYQPMTRVDLTKQVNTIPFAFDGVFGEMYDNSQIYERSVQNMIPPVLDGQHATVFAFGATGSGKTHTMMGSNFTGTKIVEDNNMGLYYMAALDVFSFLELPEYSHLTVGVSLFEIYGGKLLDLLNDRKQVKCLEDHQGKVCFPGLSEHSISEPGELIDLIELGALSRSTGTTSRNADSSRSHAVLQLHLRKDVGRKLNVEHGRLTFIDLAGSERGADTANFSRATRLEGAEINTSLLALKEVIRARARGGSMVHVPFRGSKLTQVLKESLVGENNKCVMIACIAPDMDNCEQTLNTLRYADRVKERNSETGALPSKFKRGGRRRSSALPRSTASISSIASTSDQSFQATYDKRTKKTAPKKSRYDEDSSSGNQTSIKESGPGKSSALKKGRKVAAISDDDLLSSALSEEDDTDALLTAVLSEDVLSEDVLSEDVSGRFSERENTKANSLADELVETHASFLSAVLGMVQVSQ